MKKPAKRSCLLGLIVLVGFGARPVRAADRPLLVVVEAPAAVDADAAEIRRVIGTELRSETVAPMKTQADPPERALIVALDGDRIAMSLRTSDAAPVVRSIPSPPEHAARLRAIAWLAGNLARDQVTPILADARPDISPLAMMPALPAPTDAVSAVPPPAPAHAATEPPPLAPTETITTRPETRPAGPRHWSIGIADGPMTNSFLCSSTASSFPAFCAPGAVFGTAWRLELQRRPNGSGFFWGAAVEGTEGSQFAPQFVGASAFVGSSKRLGRWTLESSAGAGLELSSSLETTVTSNHSSMNGFVSTITTDYGNGTGRPGLSADGAIAAVHPIWDALDVVCRLGAHLSTVNFSDWYLSGTIGLRYNL
jgi:hypothetical protein